MPYTPTNWVDGVTPVNEANLDKLEGGVQTAQATAEAAIAKAIVDAKGDLIAASAADTVARLAVGTNGHVLKADSAQALGVKWALEDGIPIATVDAKGDLIAATGADAVARVPVGTNGQVLMADSTQAAGVRWRSAPSAKVIRSSNFSLPHNVMTPIPFDAEVHDTDAIHDLGNNPERLTCKTAGVYAIQAYVSFSTPNTTGRRELALYVNAYDPWLGGLVAMPITGKNTDIALSGQVYLNVNDYVVCDAFQDSGVAITLGFGNHWPSLAMTRIG